VSDTWYRRSVELPPYEDAVGKLWMPDGRRVNPTTPEDLMTQAVCLQDMIQSLLDQVPSEFSFTYWMLPPGMNCPECTIDEDPAPWCDCRTEDEHPDPPGRHVPCKKRAHHPDRCPERKRHGAGRPARLG
jgi:hypothetical protein